MNAALRASKLNPYLYYLGLFAIWTIAEFILIPTYPTLNPVLKVLVWVLPVLLLISSGENEKLAPYLGLTRPSSSNLMWIAGFVLVTLVAIGLRPDYQEKPSITFDGFVNAVLLAGITEETVFRGYLLKKLQESKPFWKANLIQSLLFAAIHLPIWLRTDAPIPIVAPYVLMLGVVFGMVYRHSRNLWIVVVLHSLHNLWVIA
ncbi:CPBP family intramembrane glutamic endopeptidase [Vibrio sonorensis]|uniref:CPBP family intramembrane glutamic endopeptidase n=1 Tax=Vibrio sonorensis TaxID=1004316 RepID=UPI0008D94C76|nr:CPBP family intramembrane glutamic endopeptidase [Vibrio sonorensis]